MLAGVLLALKEERVNVQEMQNVLFSGPGAAACASIRVSRAPGEELLGRLRALEHVIDVAVK